MWPVTELTDLDPAAARRVAVLDDLAWRGLIATSTDLEALRADAAAGPITLYCGFDPTAPSMHMGNLVQILTVRRFQLAGHRPLALVGGATGLIGDPKESGERTLNPAELVAEWVARFRAQLERFYDFDSPDNAAVMVNNYDWTQGLSTLEFLRDVGKHFSVNRMLDREAVAARLAGNGISYTEFSYQLLQSYDYLQLHQQYGCTLQTGGSDQWGNIVAGVDLVRRVAGSRVHALTTPLVTKSDGTKFGKTESGTVWLDAELTSPYAWYQFWLNTEDAIVPSLLRIFSFRSHEEIEALEESLRERPQAREAQRALAEELTDLVHGVAERERVEAAAKALFGQGDVADLDLATLEAALAEAPHAEVSAGEWADGLGVADALARTGLVASKGAGRRTIAEGGAYVSNVRVSEQDAVLTGADLLHGRWILLRRGRRHIGGIRVSTT
ncbi:tyrosine--tRNA ligase [Longivirga aurantiaca]|uniref:Tyrosine--tRNA ligase n=1 Tax=Longivirga aurantiaca TaxID=1837743 RepID=A0ABW1T2U6_9ACTN